MELHTNRIETIATLIRFGETLGTSLRNLMKILFYTIIVKSPTVRVMRVGFTNYGGSNLVFHLFVREFSPRPLHIKFPYCCMLKAIFWVLELLIRIQSETQLLCPPI